MVAKSKHRLTLIESDDTPEALREAYRGKTLCEVDIVVKRPIKQKAEELVVAARLCRCRRVCIAFMEPDAF